MISLQRVAERNASSAVLPRSINDDRGQDLVLVDGKALGTFPFAFPLGYTEGWWVAATGHMLHSQMCWGVKLELGGSAQRKGGSGRSLLLSTAP